MESHRLTAYTLVCLYLNTLSATELETLKAIADEYCGLRYDSGAINDLEKQGMLVWDWQKMEVELTETGIDHATTLVREIAER